MANGVYGSNIPAGITSDDISKYVDIFYAYCETRNSDVAENAVFQKLDENYLKSAVFSDDTQTNAFIEGLYNLRLPADIFGKKGFYTIYIKPKEVEAVIADVGPLNSDSDVRGVVIDIRTLNDSPVKDDITQNNGLVGYRIVYISDDGTRTSDFRMVTSNNRCEPVITSPTTNSSKSYAYRFNESGSFSFLTVTPSMSLSFKSSSSPFIGKAGQNIRLVNTLFEPVCIELEMVTNDADTIMNALAGDQTRNLENGLITTYNEHGEITRQHEMSTLKESATGAPVYEVRVNKTSNIDYSETINDKK